ncbi:MAG: response regulator [Deltaproteobacteria bacterium]|nr:response regulator [Deltaproteobacteria bacterium]
MQFWLFVGIACVASMALLLVDVLRRETPRALRPALLVGIGGALVYAIADVMTRLTVHDPVQHWRWLVVLYGGLMCVPPAWWITSLRYAEAQGEHLSFAHARWIHVPTLSAAFFFGVLLTNPWHGAFLEPQPFRSEFRPLFWVHTAITYLAAVGAIGVQAWLALRARRPRVRANSRALAFAMCAPLVANVVYLAMPSPGELDPTIAAFTLTSAVMVFLVARRRVFSLAPVEFAELRAQDPDAVVLFDCDGHLLDANPAAHALFGAALDDPSEALRRVAKALNSGEASDDLTVDERLRIGVAPPGEVFTFVRDAARTLRVSTLVVRDERQEAAALLLRARDESELASANERARKRAALLEAVFDAAGLAVAVVDRQGRVRFGNDMMERLWKVPRGEATKGPIAELAQREPLRSSGAADGIVRLLDETSRDPNVFLRRDLTLSDGRIIEVVTVPMRDAGAVHSRLFLNADVTERRRRERAAHDAARLDDLAALAGGVAHGFNNLLAAILGNADLALLTASPEARASAHMREVRDAAERGAALANQLLAYAGRAPLREARVDLQRVVEREAAALAAEARAGVLVEVSLPAALPRVAGDAVQLGHLLAVLLRNAVESLPASGGRVAVDAYEDGSDVVLRVRDDGCGMDAETLRRAFEPFFSTKPTAKGLGLAAARGIATQHGGSLSAESEPGRGATLTLRLRRASPDTRDAVEVDAPVSAWRGAGRLLAVDDEASVLSVARQLAEDLGFEVTAVDGPSAALAAVRDAPGSYRLALVDATMPELNGPELLRRLREAAPGLPAVIYSVFTRESFTLPAEPPTEFLHKPFRRDELARAFRRALREEE